MKFNADYRRALRAGYFIEKNTLKSEHDVALTVIGAILLAILILSAIAIPSCRADDTVRIDLHKIATIESGLNPRAHNKKDDSRGLYQITPICLKEYNNFHPRGRRYIMDDLWNVSVSSEIARWYFEVRIPQMLKHYGIPDTVPNRIIAWNAGIAYLVHKKPLPKVTRIYLRKYTNG